MIDANGCDPVPLWAKHIIDGTATEKEYMQALSVNASAWVGFARYSVDKAISLAKEHTSYPFICGEHHKRGTTNKSNLEKHQNGLSRKRRDNGGEKGDVRRTPNPNKRRSNNCVDVGVGEKILSALIVVGAGAGIVYLVLNDATVVGIADDAAIAVLAPVLWDNVSKVLA